MPRLRLDHVCFPPPGPVPPFSLARLLSATPHAALVDISLELRDGERLLLSGPDTTGIIGILRLLAGRLVPASGVRDVAGSLTSIVDVERSLDTEATGRANLDRLAGMRAAEASAFAELGELLDVPVRLYSPGMRYRLAFAATSAWDGEVLLVEECLSRADLAFRPRMFHRLQQLLQRSRIAVVAEPVLAPWCERHLKLHQGRLRPAPAPAAA